MLLQMTVATEAKPKETKPIYVGPDTHRKLRVLAGLEEKSLRDLLSELLDKTVDSRIAARLINTKAQFKRQAARNGKAKR